MEKINLNNYEAYFLDFLEGNLSLEEQRDLSVFLDDNPILKSELDVDISDLNLLALDEKYDSKESLKVAENDLLITKANVEDLMVASIEDQLNPKQEVALAEFVDGHKLNKDFDTYKKTLLKADLTEVLEDKDEFKVRPVIIPLYMKVASFAAVGILLIGLAINSTSAKSPKGIASTNHAMIFSADLQPEIKFDKISVKQNSSGIAEVHIQKKSIENRNELNNELIPKEDIFVEEEEKVDSTDKEDVILPIEQDNIVEIIDSIPQIDLDDDVAENRIIEVQPIKLITDAAGNFFNKDISFVRNKEEGTDEYIAYSFNIGNFQFERKRGR